MRIIGPAWISAFSIHCSCLRFLVLLSRRNEANTPASKAMTGLQIKRIQEGASMSAATDPPAISNTGNTSGNNERSKERDCPVPVSEVAAGFTDVFAFSRSTCWASCEDSGSTGDLLPARTAHQYPVSIDRKRTRLNS